MFRQAFRGTRISPSTGSLVIISIINIRLKCLTLTLEILKILVYRWVNRFLIFSLGYVHVYPCFYLWNLPLPLCSSWEMPEDLNRVCNVEDANTQQSSEGDTLCPHWFFPGLPHLHCWHEHSSDTYSIFAEWLGEEMVWDDRDLGHSPIKLQNSLCIFHCIEKLRVDSCVITSSPQPSPKAQHIRQYLSD